MPRTDKQTGYYSDDAMASLCASLDKTEPDQDSEENFVPWYEDDEPEPATRD